MSFKEDLDKGILNFFRSKNKEPDTRILEYGRMRKFGATQEAYIDPKAEYDVFYWKGFCEGVKMQMELEAKK